MSLEGIPCGGDRVERDQGLGINYTVVIKSFGEIEGAWSGLGLTQHLSHLSSHWFNNLKLKKQVVV